MQGTGFYWIIKRKPKIHVFEYWGVGHVISNLAVGVGQSFLCRREGVGHVFFIIEISKGPGPSPPPHTFFTSPLRNRDGDGSENFIFFSKKKKC